MTYDAVHQTAQDTPATAWQHHWKNAARADTRLKATHLALVDAYAEHYYDGKAAWRGVGLSVERAVYWTRLSPRSINGARRDLVKWGWLGLVRAHGDGRVARYALTRPDLGITGEVIPKDCTSCNLAGVEHGSQDCTSCTSKGVKIAPRADIPLPIPLHLPTAPPEAAPIVQPPATTAPRRGRQGEPSTNNPKTAAATRAALERAIPAAVLSSARGARSAPVLATELAGALAAGWTPEQVRAELDGADTNARNPVGVVVSRLRSLAATPPPAARPATITDAQIQAALAAGQECEHGNPQILTAANLPYCPICRRSAATA